MAQFMKKNICNDKDNSKAYTTNCDTIKHIVLANYTSENLFRVKWLFTKYYDIYIYIYIYIYIRRV